MKNDRMQIPGYEGLYELNANGDVFRKSYTRTLKSGKISIKAEKKLKPTYDATRGYLRVALKDGSGKFKSHSQHRLVAMVFHPNPLNKRTVNHKDGDRYNNHPDNLEWASDQEQVSHAWGMGLQPRKRKTYPKNLTSIIHAMRNEGTTIADIARATGLARAGVRYHLKKAI